MQILTLSLVNQILKTATKHQPIYIIIGLFLLLGTNINAQSFYDLNTVQTIEITFAQSNWDQLLDNEKAGNDGYIMAQSISINGVVFDSIGVKYKGNSTYNPNQTKNPFHIELNTYKDHIYDGYTDIKLSNVAKDPSFLREVLSYQILRQYMDAPLSNYANVSVNGNLIGLYSSSEAVSRKFVDKYFYSKNNTRVKCNPPAGAGPQSNDFPNLVYLGQDSTNYYDAYELKSDYGWDELIDLCDTLANNINDIEMILDVDRALWMLAFDNMLVNLDSYIGGFAQNYYLYRDDNGRFVPVVWDLNESFGRFTMTGSGNVNTTIAKQRMDHLLHLNNTSYPLINKLLNVPMYKRMYLAHCKTMLEENFDNNSYFSTGQTLQGVIDAAVQADGNKFFSYNNFLDNLTSDVGGGGGPGGGATIGITNLMNGRNAYLLSLPDFIQTAPTISNVIPSNSTPVLTETVTINASLTDETTVYLGFRSDVKLPFTKIIMYDDGAHNDGAANDGIYGADVVMNNTYVQYYIYAENTDAGRFSPRRAEHEFHILNATGSPTVGDIVINEFMASNNTTQADQDGEFDDWIELYNNGTTAIDLDGYSLSDDATDLVQWAFPAGTTIAAGGYLVVWADNDIAQAGLHANFKLSSAAETIYLVNTSGNIVDEVSYIAQTTDISYGRYPNGTGNFQTMSPTFNAENTNTTSVTTVSNISLDIKVFPNPASDFFYLEITEEEAPKERLLAVYNLNGSLVYENTMTHHKRIETSNWPAGMYFVSIENSFLKIIVN